MSTRTNERSALLGAALPKNGAADPLERAVARALGSPKTFAKAHDITDPDAARKAHGEMAKEIAQHLREKHPELGPDKLLELAQRAKWVDRMTGAALTGTNAGVAFGPYGALGGVGGILGGVLGGLTLGPAGALFGGLLGATGVSAGAAMYAGAMAGAGGRMVATFRKQTPELTHRARASAISVKAQDMISYCIGFGPPFVLLPLAMIATVLAAPLAAPVVGLVLGAVGIAIAPLLSATGGFFTALMQEAMSRRSGSPWLGVSKDQSGKLKFDATKLDASLDSLRGRGMLRHTASNINSYYDVLADRIGPEFKASVATKEGRATSWRNIKVLWKALVSGLTVASVGVGVGIPPSTAGSVRSLATTAVLLPDWGNKRTKTPPAKKEAVKAVPALPPATPGQNGKAPTPGVTPGKGGAGPETRIPTGLPPGVQR